MKIALLLGTIGMLSACFGALLEPCELQKVLFLAGAVMMFLAAVLEQQRFFIALQVILLSGTLIAFAPLEAWMKVAVPISVSAITVLALYRVGAFEDKLGRLGAVGMTVLAIGYAITHPAVYLVGGATLALYAWNSYRAGVQLAILWAVLNAVFAVTAGVGLYRMI
ncbi:hypothetical protein OAO01_04350 [Oligoflexia bacterium]|nr:hypothetical protein [Oligoflexia bacterium]